LHRWILGVQFGGVLIAAVGAATLFDGARALYRSGRVRLRPALYAAVVGIVAVLVGFPPPAQPADYAIGDRVPVHEQQAYSAKFDRQLHAIIDEAKRLGGGRLYAGSTTNFGAEFLVGHSPVYLAIFARHAPGIGYTGRAATLSTDTEHEFDP